MNEPSADLRDLLDKTASRLKEQRSTQELGTQVQCGRGLEPRSPPWQEQLSLVWVLTWREIRDTLRDWRIVFPIGLLTLIFPVVLNIAASLVLAYVRQYNAAAVGQQAIPLMLLVVGFFPISFSLVIALETFVGEKERRSLEPLLATPLSNTQLYLGKTLAALIPPVLASYLGIAVYLASLLLRLHYRPPCVLVLQVLLLTTAEALVMVSGAVIISSQTTSVRAANLLASFIILPIAFLIQGEALIMFWSRYDVLWHILLALIVIDVILVRMGVRVFNREELLGREIDTINLKRIWHLFKGYLLEPPKMGLPIAQPQPASGAQARSFRLIRFYRSDVPELLRMNRAAVAVVLVSLVGATLSGWFFALNYPLPTGVITLEDISGEAFTDFEGSRFLPSLSVWGVLNQNVRSLLAAGLLAVLSFGTLAIVLLMAPLAVIGFAAAQVAHAGYNPLLFVGVFFLPHGIAELPAAILATAAAVRLGMAIVSPPAGMTLSQSLLRAVAHFLKLFILVVLPLLVVAAFIEVKITPQLVVTVYGS